MFNENRIKKLEYEIIQKEKKLNKNNIFMRHCERAMTRNIKITITFLVVGAILFVAGMKTNIDIINALFGFCVTCLMGIIAINIPLAIVAFVTEKMIEHAEEDIPDLKVELSKEKTKLYNKSHNNKEKNNKVILFPTVSKNLRNDNAVHRDKMVYKPKTLVRKKDK